MKPLIGLMPLVDEERESLWMVPGYMDALKVAGANPIMLPLMDDADSIDQLVERCDGLMFTGGHDINPALYHQAPIAQLGAVSHERDRMEKMAFERAMALGKPMLGICRGLQLFNALLGGTLWQDLSSQHPSHVPAVSPSVPWKASRAGAVEMLGEVLMPLGEASEKR